MDIPPEHQFNVDQETWDDAVFTNAAYFTVVIGRSPFNRAVEEFKRFDDALTYAKTFLAHTEHLGSFPRPMIYAVTASGRHTMLVPKRWDHYVKLAETRA